MLKNGMIALLALAVVACLGLFGTAGYREIAHRLPNRAQLSEFAQVRHERALATLQQLPGPVAVQGTVWVQFMDRCFRAVLKDHTFPAEGLGVPWVSARQTPADRQRVLDVLDERCAAEILDRVVLASPDGAAALASLALVLDYQLPLVYEHMALDHPNPLDGLATVQWGVGSR